MGPSAPAPLTTPVLRARWCTPPHAATGLMRPSPVSTTTASPAPTARRLACLRPVSPDRGVTGRRDRRPGPLQGLHHRLSASAWSPPSTPRAPAGPRAPSRRPASTHARRLLIEAAWHHAPAYRPSKAIRARWALAPAPVAERADAGNRRQTRPLPGPDRPPRRSTPWSPPPSPDRAPAGCGPWQPWTPRTSTTTTTSTTSTTGTAQPGTQEP